ncbi:MAG: hypothetical protein ACRCTI_20855, partial [Beijerinckiaceae bacterium]
MRSMKITYSDFKWNLIRYIQYATENLSRSFSWSNLKNIGSSRIVQLSIAAPFIGYAILFNEHTYKLLDEIPYGIVKGDYRLKNVYFLYFGLTLMGFSTLIYNIFAPEEVKLYDGAIGYVDKIREVSNVNLLDASIDRILEEFDSHVGFSTSSGYIRTPSA